MAKKTIKRRSRRLKRNACFITIEGLEGSGKSSVILFVKELLEAKGFSVRIFRDPGTTDIGEQIRTILLDRRNSELSAHTELLLYLASRTQLIEEKIKPALKGYDFVICDRFFDSTLAYQGYGLGLAKTAERGVKLFSLGLVPDLTLFLDTPVQEGLNRIADKDRIESRSIDFHRTLRRGFLSLVRRYPNRIKKVNAKGTLKEIYPRVAKLLGKVLKRKHVIR